MAFIEETRHVTTLDTREPVTAPVLLDCHMNGGYDWMEEITDRGWATPGLWGAEGWDLGQWPYAIVATRTHETEDGPLYGFATYVEGDVQTRWYRLQPRCWEAISAEAFGWWQLSGRGPTHLPETAADLPEDLRRPFTGFPN